MKSFIIVLFTLSYLVAEVISPFKVRYQKNINGNIEVIGNTLLTAPTKLFVENQPPLETSNDTIAMRYVNIDKTKRNSSAATLQLKEHSKVLYAALYWGARSTKGDKQKGQIALKSPHSTYTTLTASQVHSAKTKGYYSAFAEVTKLVQNGGNGEYVVANIEAMTGKDSFGGWALVVIYENQNLPLRSMTLFDGYAIVPPNVEINVEGFKTPKEGNFAAYLNTIAFEGDFENSGDGLILNGHHLEDHLNSRDNFFNSQITYNGKHVHNKRPDYQNQMGLDIKQINITGLLPNNSTKAAIQFETHKDFYQPMVLTFVSDYDTDLTHAQSVKTKGVRKHGETVTFSSIIRNKVDRDAFNLSFSNTLPDGLHYIADSLTIDGVKVPSSEINRTITANIPKIMGKNDVNVTFLATIDLPDHLPFSSILENQSIVTYEIKSLGIKIVIPSDSDPIEPDVQATKIVIEDAPATLGIIQRENSYAQTTLKRGQNLLLTATLTNPSKYSASKLHYHIVLPQTLHHIKESFNRDGHPLSIVEHNGSIEIDLGRLEANATTTFSYKVNVESNEQELYEKVYALEKVFTYIISGSNTPLKEKRIQQLKVEELPVFAKAKQDLHDGNASSAYTILDNLFFDHMGSIDVNHYLARAASENEAYDEALAAYERLLILDEFNPQYNLEVARLYVDTAAYTDAKGILRALKDLNASQQKEKEELLKRIEAARDRWTWIALSNLTTGYDSNVKSAAERETLNDYYTSDLNTTVPSTVTDPVGDLFASGMVNIIGIYDIGKKDGFYLQGMLTGLAKLYLSQNDFNLLFAKGVGTLGYKLGNIKITLPLEGDHVNFGGKNLLNSVAAAPSVNIKHNAQYSSAYTLRYQRKRYIDTANSSKNTHNAIANASLIYHDKIHTITLGYRGQYAWKVSTSSSDQYLEFLAHNMSANYTAKLPYRLTANAKILFRKIFYTGDNAKLLNSTTNRQDDQSGLTLGVKHKLMPKLSVGAQYGFSNNSSNFVPLTYIKHTIQLMADYRF